MKYSGTINKKPRDKGHRNNKDSASVLETSYSHYITSEQKETSLSIISSAVNINNNRQYVTF